MKVNMTPNPLDVVTIHASQGDTEARQWEFELHNNGELIDTSDVKEQLVFKAYKGGTEQLLPENGSTPTTSPFKGDIKYPQGLLADQEFTYRQSPTESDGLAKITDIKGNTLVWNQLVQNGNFASSSGWGINGGTLAVANNIATLTANASVAYVQIYRDGFTLNTSHKYLIKFNYNATNITNFLRAIVNSTDGRTYVQLGQNTSNSGTLNIIVTPSLSATRLMFAFVTNGNANGSGTISNVQMFDLTQMGLDSITDPSEFTSLFPLPYYDYNAGALLSFNGTGLKTTGKNQLNPSVFDYGSVYEYSNGNLTVKSSDPRAWTTVSTFHLKKGNYIFTRSVPNGICDIRFEYENFATSHLIANQLASYSFTVAQDTDVKIKVGYSYSSYPFTTNVMIRFADTDDTFEPYTSSTLSLPISTYFPSGMKSAGNAYDELTESKAITRVGAVDLGTLAWNYTTSYAHPVFYANIMGVNLNSDLICTKFEFAGNIYASAYQFAQGASDNSISANSSGNNQIYVRADSITTVNDFKTYVNSVVLNYGLATPTETSFTTASLVTENAEIPLSNNDGTLIGKCTEQLSENPGFIDAKIKLADADGECYSNKIQLHVERSPQ